MNEYLDNRLRTWRDWPGWRKAQPLRPRDFPACPKCGERRPWTAYGVTFCRGPMVGDEPHVAACGYLLSKPTLRYRLYVWNLR